MPVCKSCTDKYFSQLIDFFSGNEEKAIERVCSIYDWYFDEEAASSTKKISADRSRIGAYPSKLNLQQSSKRGDTYLDTIKQRANNTIDSVEKLEEINKSEDSVSVSDRTVKRWGLGYTPEEYEDMNIRYKSLKEQSPTDDPVTESLIKDLCSIKIQQMRTMQGNGDVDKYAKLTKLYQETLSSANLKPKSAKDSASTTQADSFGTWQKDIERFTPSEYFKDKSIYKDADSFGEYFQRFIARPFKNLITGSKELDAEYSVGQVQSGDDLDGQT